MVNVSANISPFTKGLKDARKDLGGFVDALKSPFSTTNSVFAGLAGAGVAAYAKSVSEAVDASSKLSDQLGVGMESMIGLQHGAALAGVSNEGLATSLGHMVRSLGEAHAGGEEARAAFEGLGLSAEDLGKMPTENALAQVADQISRLPTAAEKANAAFKVFGKGGLPMLSLIQDGAEGLRAATEEAKKFGLAVSRGDAASIEAANDALTRMGQALKGGATQAVVELAPHITGLASALTDAGAVGEGFGEKFGKSLETVAYTFFVVEDLAKKAFLPVKALAGGLLSAATLASKLNGGSLFGSTTEELRGGVQNIFDDLTGPKGAAHTNTLAEANQKTQEYMGGVNKRRSEAKADADRRARDRAALAPSALAPSASPGQPAALDKKGVKAAEDDANKVRQLMEGFALDPLDKHERDLFKGQQLFDRGAFTEAFGDAKTALQQFAVFKEHLHEDLLKGLKAENPLDDLVKGLSVTEAALAKGKITAGEYADSVKNLNKAFDARLGVKNPLADFTEQMNLAAAARKAGKIGADKEALAAFNAAEALKGALPQEAAVARPQAMEFGSSAAVSTIIRSMGGQDGGGRDIAELIRAANAQQKQQVEQGREIIRQLERIYKNSPVPAGPI